METVVDERYCVPKANSATTKEVFNLLSQLIALNVKPGDLPYTPTVRVAP